MPFLTPIDVSVILQHACLYTAAVKRVTTGTVHCVLLSCRIRTPTRDITEQYNSLHVIVLPVAMPTLIQPAEHQGQQDERGGQKLKTRRKCGECIGCQPIQKEDCGECGDYK